MPAHPRCLNCTPCARHRSRRVSAGPAPTALHLAADAVELVLRALAGHADGLAMRARHSPEEDRVMIAESIRCSHLAGLIRRNVPTAA